ncbi:hypothetical protein HY493_03890 [Candidatus Woesearchaeota archaeon]|nr:hypothetical protein [Candidatus Woesearchaeota archaeon]
MSVLQFAERGFLARAEDQCVLIGEGPVDQPITGIVRLDRIPDAASFGVIRVEKLPCGLSIQLPDSTVVYAQQSFSAREAKSQRCDVLILAPGVSDEKAVKVAKPKLAILQNSTLDRSREIQRKTGIQTIVANAGTVINLAAYSARSGQTRLV